MRPITSVLLSVAVTLCVSATVHAGQKSNDNRGYNGHHDRYSHDRGHSSKNMSFKRIATVPNYVNNDEIGDSTVSEIIAATKDGKTLVYTDASTESVGFIHISNPRQPVSFGTLNVGGEPTSVDILGNQFALVAVNTSPDLLAPSGQLHVVDIAQRNIVATHELGGQPDSLKVSPDSKYAAIVIENERDEEIEVNGEEGGLPQLPAGFLLIVDIDGKPADWNIRQVDLSGLSLYAPADPEPEFVDINANNEAAVSLQENNHLAIVDLATGAVTSHFSMGTVDLYNVDNNEDGLISLTDSIAGVPREPDAISWIELPDGSYRIATANEGDLFGGSRGFSVFDRQGSIVYDSGNEFEKIAVAHGHYPEDRSENKGAEPESVEFARFGRTDYLFVGSERGSFVAVYELNKKGEPSFRQVLPAPLGPEGVLAIPDRGLLIASGEEDDPPYGVRSSVMIYELQRGEADYPQLVSGPNAEGLPIGWSALSGMVAKPWSRKNELLAVWDSYYSEGRVFTIDASQEPAVITNELPIVGNTVDMDSEGIAVAPDGTYWIASEGNATDTRPNTLFQVDPQTGLVIREVGLPENILACRAASTTRGTLGSGFEGVAVKREWWRGYKLLVAQQRGWNYTTPECEALDDDPDGLDPAEPSQTRIWIFDPRTGEWDHIAYELEDIGENASWVGLSEITQVGDGSYLIIERDNRTGDFTELKTLVRVPLRAAYDGVIEKHEKAVFDLLPAMQQSNGWITDKPEGVAVTRNGQVFLVTDNDGVEDWSGETSFLNLGRVWKLFKRR
ncbi:MAG: esterase-like activity of phytase family protein [Woeseia sp.]